MKTDPYAPLTEQQIARFRELLPHIVAWLRAREGRRAQ